MKVFVKVKPRARENKIEKIDEENFVVSVKAPPIDGKATEAALKSLADHFDVPEACVRLVSGFSSRHKIYEIEA